MSSRVKTRTPFLNKAILLQALKTIGCGYTEAGGEILTQRTDHFGNQRFILQDGRYFFQHDQGQYNLRNIGTAAHESVHSFLGAIEKEYNRIIARMEEESREAERERARLEQEYKATLAKKEAEKREKERLEQEYKAALAKEEAAKRERERIEAERVAFVAKQKETIIAKARALGYSVREKTEQETVKLVLVRNTY
ncbi:hypothetical protein FACS1894200_02830 [Spirochaetia bacterium]|nr:hypothetical protein FACS1894200_02830 [Spirochaetia bacterium]